MLISLTLIISTIDHIIIPLLIMSHLLLHYYYYYTFTIIYYITIITIHYYDVAAFIRLLHIHYIHMIAGGMPGGMPMLMGPGGP